MLNQSIQVFKIPANVVALVNVGTFELNLSPEKSKTHLAARLQNLWPPDRVCGVCIVGDGVTSEW